MAGHFVRIFLFMLAVVGAYAYVGQLLPQFEEHPPAKKVITPQTSPGDLVQIGEELLRGKGGCLVCHKVTEAGNERGPDLRKAMSAAASRRPDKSAEDYLLESLIDPGAYLVSGFPPMMSPALQPPVNLSMAEVKAVVAYLQALGGAEVSVTVTAEDVVPAKAPGRQHRGKTLAAQYGCLGCHKAEGEGGTVGPDITKAAATREPAELLRKIVEPSAWTTPGFQAGIMSAEIGRAIPEGDRHEIVAWLATLAGKSYSPTGAASPWSHEGVRLGLAIFFFNVAMLAALALAARRERRA